MPIYPTPKFSDVWESFDDFMTDYAQSKIGNQPISDEAAQILYYALYARYGNTPIINSDVNQWKYKVFLKIFSFGPTWEKKLDIQKKIREMSERELKKGSGSIHNHAYNPPGEPTTQTNEELAQVDDQSVSKYTRSKIDALSNQYGLLISDVTESFLDRFASLFMPVLDFDPVLFPSEDDDYE